MSKPEDNRNEWLTRQCAADQASSLAPFVAELASDECYRAGLEKQARLAALKAAVVEAAKRWQASRMFPAPGGGNDERVWLERGDAEKALDAACAALAKLEANHA